MRLAPSANQRNSFVSALGRKSMINVDMMLEKDEEAQKLLEQCLVRMPNQNVSKEEARQVIEFMRSNDGEK